MLLNITTLNNIVYEIIEQKKKTNRRYKTKCKLKATQKTTHEEKKRKNFNNRRNLLGG